MITGDRLVSNPLVLNARRMNVLLIGPSIEVAAFNEIINNFRVLSVELHCLRVKLQVSVASY